MDSDFLLAHSVTQGRNDVQQIPVHRAGARLEGALRDPGVGVLADGDRLGRPCGRAARAVCPLVALDQAALVGEPPRGASLRCVGGRGAVPREVRAGVGGLVTPRRQSAYPTQPRWLSLPAIATPRYVSVHPGCGSPLPFISGLAVSAAQAAVLASRASSSGAECRRFESAGAPSDQRKRRFTPIPHP